MLAQKLIEKGCPVDVHPNGSIETPWLTLLPAGKEPSLPLSEEAGEILYREQADNRKEIVVSLGKEAVAEAETYRQAGGKAARWCIKNKVGTIQVDVDALGTNLLTPVLEGLLLGAYEFKRYKQSETVPETGFQVELITRQPASISDQVYAVRVTCGAVLTARDWGHEPANVINPVSLAGLCQDFFAGSPVQVKVLDEKQLADMGAGAILGVGQGSQTPPRLIALEYPGSGKRQGSKPVALVGKAITFDTGGYSIKDSTNILGMKYDKCGGMTVAATVAAAAALGLETPLVGLISAAENMISAQAYRPDDILKSLSGKTIEIISTDAEGRLVLADALTYAQTQYRPQAVIDLATLTGGVVVALGRARAGLMSNNDELAEALFACGEQTHERLWRLPLDDDYLKPIQGDEADLKNSAGREGHAIFGGIFLEQFIADDQPWAHLDIAGTADTPKDLPYSVKGATGFGVRLLIRYLQNLS